MPSLALPCRKRPRLARRIPRRIEGGAEETTMQAMTGATLMPRLIDTHRSSAANARRRECPR